MNNSKKVLRILGIVFIAVAIIVVVIFSFVITSNDSKKEEYDLITARISDIETEARKTSDGTKYSHKVYVEYIYDGHRYEDVYLSFYSSSMHVGGEVDVYVNPDDPYDLYYDVGNFLIIFPIIFGGVFGIAGIVMLIFGIGSKGRSELTHLGIAVEAFVTYCGRSNVTVNDAPTYVIKAEYTDANGQARSVKTDLLDFDPTAYVMQNAGKIMVYVDPKKPSRYYIDTAVMLSAAYNPAAYAPNAYAPNGGYNPNGYNPNGYNPNGYNPNGFSQNNPNGYNQNNPNGYNQDGTPRY